MVADGRNWWIAFTSLRPTIWSGRWCWSSSRLPQIENHSDYRILRWRDLTSWLPDFRPTWQVQDIWLRIRDSLESAQETIISSVKGEAQIGIMKCWTATCLNGCDMIWYDNDNYNDIIIMERRLNDSNVSSELQVTWDQYRGRRFSIAGA